MPVLDQLTLKRPDALLVGERAGNGNHILLLHAGGETRAVWRPVMDALASRGFQSYAFDQRGHGESGGSTSDGLGAYGEDTKAMIGLMSRPLVVGASLGGFALMVALETLEQQVSGLVLVDVTPTPDPERARTYLSPRGLAASPLVENILGQTERMAQIVRALKLPILYVSAGARSPLGEEGRVQIRTLAAHAVIEIVPEASHLVARDAPARLANLIGDFAARLNKPKASPP
ncbi:MAG: alpha/beta fold hydrolase [Alphaproteobacteria bacterium]|nr:alpha/beta fold hydrolase [Alphaproteobacteria bacterium]